MFWISVSREGRPYYRNDGVLLNIGPGDATTRDNSGKNIENETDFISCAFYTFSRVNVTFYEQIVKMYKVKMTDSRFKLSHERLMTFFSERSTTVNTHTIDRQYRARDEKKEEKHQSLGLFSSADPYNTDFTCTRCTHYSPAATVFAYYIFVTRVIRRVRTVVATTITVKTPSSLPNSNASRNIARR